MLSWLARHRAHGCVALLVVVLLWLGQSLWSEERWMFKLTHKSSTANTATTLSSQDQQHPHWSQFEHFLVHTPKSGGSFAFDMLVDMLQTNPHYQSLTPNDQFMVCDGRTRSTADFEKYYPLTGRSSSSSSFWHHRGTQERPCTLWMAEQPYTAKARHNYIVLRDPRSHILSQYFHCKESINHYDRWKYMPSLTEWLRAWVSAIGNETLAKAHAKTYKCFDPRNMQTRFTGLNRTMVQALNTMSTTNRDVDGEDNVAVARALASQFVVVGDNHRMWESICTIFIRYTSWIPVDCDCSSSSSTTMNQDRRQLKIHFYGHGVRHHGNSFVTTSEQDDLLAQLMKTDQPLYDVGQDVFEAQTKALEAEHGIRLCPKKPSKTNK